MDNIKSSEIIEIILENVPDIDGLEEEQSLRELGIDSLDFVSLFLGIQEKYDVKISDEDMKKLDTVNMIVEYLSEK